MAINPTKHNLLTDTQKIYSEFWKLFNELSIHDEKFSRNFRVHPYASVRGYQDFSIGYGFHIVLKINRFKSEACIGCYFENLELYAEFFNHYRKQIEEDLGVRLMWSEYATKGSAYHIVSTNIEIDSEWPQLIHFMMDDAIMMKSVFEKYLNS